MLGYPGAGESVKNRQQHGDAAILVHSVRGGFAKGVSQSVRTCLSTIDKRCYRESVNFGAPSPLEALHWIFCFFSRFGQCNLVRRAPQNLEKVAKRIQWRKSRSNPVTSEAVMVFSAR